MTESQIIELLQSLPETDRAVYLNPSESYLEEERLLELSENIGLEFKVNAHCNYVLEVAVIDETGRHKYEYVPVDEAMEIYSPKIYIDGDFAFNLMEDIIEHFYLIT